MMLLLQILNLGVCGRVQGATCYMNSLLQMFYHMPRFRQAVYHMPTTEAEDPKKSISLSLKNLFYNLQYSSTPVSAKDLISSFGWGTADAFQQHDVEEFELKLCEKLEEKMKSAPHSVIDDRIVSVIGDRVLLIDHRIVFGIVPA